MKLRWLVVGVIALGGGCGSGSSADDDTDGGTVGTETTMTTGSTGGDSTGVSSIGTASSEGGESSGDTAGLACELPALSQEDLDNLVLSAGWDSLVPVGGTSQIVLGVLEAGPPFPIDACVAWSLQPADGASIDADGLVSIDAATEAGQVYTVTADVEEGRRILTMEITTYVPVSSPILGNWTEVSQIPCMGPPDPIVPESVINELTFDDTGEFRVTWQPFELYVDYGGTWTYDEGSGALELTVTGGNYVPPDVDGSGTATIDAGTGALTLTDIWLGTPIEGVAPAQCGHLFE
jgi:hypothetical protein